MSESHNIIRYYLLKSGIISGPYTLSQINSRVVTGEIGKECAFSEDRKTWNNIGILIPSLQDFRQPQIMPSDEQPSVNNASDSVPVQTDISDMEREVEEILPSDTENSFHVTLGKISKVPWNAALQYQDLLNHPRFTCIFSFFYSAIITAAASYIFVRYNSIQYSCILAVLFFLFAAGASAISCFLFFGLMLSQNAPLDIRCNIVPVTVALHSMITSTPICCILALFHGLSYPVIYAKAAIALFLVLVTIHSSANASALLQEHISKHSNLSADKTPVVFLTFCLVAILLYTIVILILTQRTSG